MGASSGNTSLSHIRVADAIFQMVQYFDDAGVVYIEGDVDPVHDLGIISEDLHLKDIGFVEKLREKLVTDARRNGQSLEMKRMKIFPW